MNVAYFPFKFKKGSFNCGQVSDVLPATPHRIGELFVVYLILKMNE